ncbi:MAG: hypothetical protein GDA46_03180 [Bdellovibrionales bacterium]|nr:hypothetical protein [Bdellovibrionales bacterium]
MKILLLALLVFCFSSKGNPILDILKEEKNTFFLKKTLKTDIGSVFPFSFVGKDLFTKSFENKDFRKSLEIWIQFIKGTSFEKSSTGVALYSYLLFKNQLEYLALQYLFKNSRPQDIDPLVKQLWKTTIDHPIWRYFYFPLTSNWWLIFTPERVIQVSSKNSFDLIKDHDFIKSLLTLPVKKNFNNFSLEWSFMLSFIQRGEIQSATKLLSWFLSQKKSADSFEKDKIHITTARLLADIQEFETALSYYQKINQISYLKLLALEEMSWILLKQKKYSKALELAFALSYPGFNLSPSMFFVLALTQFKNCNYQGSFKTLMKFKTSYAERNSRLKSFLKKKNYHHIYKELLFFYSSKKNPLEVGINLSYHLRKDENLKNYVLLDHYLSHKPKLLTEDLENLQKEEWNLVKKIKEDRDKRLEFLLKQELEDINKFLTYFHILEAETLYKYHTHKNLFLSSSKSKSLSSYLTPPRNYFLFPIHRDEIWLDEIFNYKAIRKKTCFDMSHKL